jgi:tripartite-type tricarboxylate transporter receptor subunit TctC
MSHRLLDRRQLLALLAAVAASPALGSDTALAPLTRLRMVSGISAGSTADRIVRAMSAAAQRLLPGAHIDTENANGSVRTLSEVAVAPADPPILAMIGGSVLYDILQDSEDAATRFNTINFIGSIGRDYAALYATKKSGIATLDDLKAASVPLFVPVSSVKTATYINSLLINAMIGTRLQPVPGYPSATRKIAILSGEVNIAVGSTDSYSDLVEQDVLVPLMRLRGIPYPAPYASLPALPALATGPEAPALLELMAAVMGHDRILIAQPLAAPDQVAALRELFAEIVRDPQFITESGLGDALTSDDHLAVEQSVGKILDQRETLGPVLAKSLACGVSMGSDGACS